MAFSDPKTILDRFGLQEGMKVADLGAGSGFYTMEAARRVGSGVVYSIEIQEDLITRLRAELGKQHLTAELIHGDMESVGGTKIKDNIIDAALVCNVLFQVENKDAFLDEIRRILRPGGRVLLVEWSDSFGGTGPQPSFVVTDAAAIELFKKHNFAEVSRIPAGDHHYGISFRKDI